VNIRRLGLLAATALVVVACSSNTTGEESSATDAPAATSSGSAPGSGAVDAAPGDAPGAGSTKVGFIFVGPKDDFGYNQAAYAGSQAVAEAHPDLEILTAENVPEDDNATRVMEKMVDDGAKIIFATSYGHLDPAMKIAAEHPDVVVVQQGNVISGTVPPNAGTYFGTVYEPVYLAGIAAGSVTESNKLGYIYAFPIPQTIANINAFQLGARSVNPDAETYVVNTSNWCDPAKQAEAASSLIAQGVDVLTQHQDCTATITKAAEEAGIMVVGYHADASELAPNGWVTGSEWDWGALYNDIVDTAIAGEFTGSPYNANYRVGYKDGGNPFVQSAYGSMVDDDTKALIAEQLELISTTGSPFAGPVTAQDGTLLFEDGEIAGYDEIEGRNTAFVEGVVGDIPQG
jgi:simple sugar transport system substrate-binding protein/basic membrane protein A